MDDVDDNISDAKFLRVIFAGKGFKKDEFAGNNYSIPDDDTNILNFKMFDNLESIKIDNAQYYDGYYPFCLDSFLSILTSTRIKHVEIRGYPEDDTRTSWLNYVWNKESSQLMHKYKNKGYMIEFVDDEDIHLISVHKE